MAATVCSPWRVGAMALKSVEGKHSKETWAWWLRKAGVPHLVRDHRDTIPLGYRHILSPGHLGVAAGGAGRGACVAQ